MMSIIEKLGGYEKAKKLRGTTSNALLDMKTWQVHVDDIDSALLKYRRANNIFEVGDWFVSDAILKPYKIIEKNGDYLKLWCKETTAEFSGNAETLSQIFKNAKHATDEEIAAGRRL